MNRILLAEALNFAPAGTVFRDTVTAAGKYGLISGNYNSESLSLTPLGQRLARPASEDARLEALREAMIKVPLFGRLLDHFDNNRLPSVDVLKGILEKPPFGVDATWSREAGEVFIANGQYTGVIREVSGSPYVLKAAGRPLSQPDTETPIDVQEDIETPSDIGAPSEDGSRDEPTPPAAQPTPRQFFIAHGRDKEALAQLQKILRDLDIPYMVAEEEANAGRPVSQKIADIMRACSAGIFIFSGDDEMTDADGKTVKRPRPNVVYELGAASLQYGQRIVIFKERGVEFPTDFRDLGYIEYDKGHLSATAMELLRELIKLRAVRVTPG
jgi:predicted nucleotide-binding protein